MNSSVMAIILALCEAVRRGTPLLLGTTGEILNEKSGSLNLGVEGTMAVGAITGALLGLSTSNMFLALLGAFVGGMFCGLIYAFLTITLKANQNVTGLAITIFGGGLCMFVGETLKSTGKFPSYTTEFFAEITGGGIPLLKDIPYIGQLLFSYNALVYIAIVIALIVWIYITKTKSGLRMRAAGENPAAADSVGINVDAERYKNIVIGSGIMGLGGVYMALFINNGLWNTDWINGYGWIAVALVIFSNWSSARAIWGSYVFGLLLALKSRMPSLASAFPSVLSWSTAIPTEVFDALPFIVTMLVLIISSMRKNKKTGCPTGLGLNYFREER